jgi:hypothetical protein
LIGAHHQRMPVKTALSIENLDVRKTLFPLCIAQTERQVTLALSQNGAISFLSAARSIAL